MPQLLKFKFIQNLPTLPDSDPDFESHWSSFMSVLDCHAYGRAGKVRPYDVLVLLKQTLPSERKP